MYFTDFSIKTSFSLEYRDGFERLLGLDHAKKDRYGGAYYRQGLSADDEAHEREIMEAWGRYCIEGKWPDEN